MQDLTTIQTKLNDDLFATTQETCLTLCRVQDVTKKSKDKIYILCACSKYIRRHVEHMISSKKKLINRWGINTLFTIRKNFIFKHTSSNICLHEF
jgi:hypothetical protein